MTDTCYQFSVEYLNEGGELIGSVPFDPDWDPARECTRWEGVRRGLVPETAAAAALRIAPVWDDVAGPPVMSAARLETPDGIAVGDHIPTLPYFRSIARERSADMIERGLLKVGAPYLYRVCAYARATPAQVARAARSEGLAFDVEEVAQPLTLKERSLDSFLQASRVSTLRAGDEMPVFIPQRVMVEASAQSRAAGRLETGGILLGRVHRSAQEPEVFLEVTAMIPAPHTAAESQRLTFTHETWSAVQDALVLRRSDELQIGWFHFHPRFCAKCPPESQKICVWARPFFSGEDVHMHRTIFPRAFQIALLLSDIGEPELDASLFGWKQGVVANRGFHILE